MTTRLLRTVFAFLLASTLAATALPAGPLFESGDSPAAITAPDPLDLVARFWSFVNQYRMKNGCQVDPNGQCLPKSRPAIRKNGCQIDPSGHCLPSATVTTKNGCQIDPNGHCLPGTTTVTVDNGCSVDPDGRCVR